MKANIIEKLIKFHENAVFNLTILKNKKFYNICGKKIAISYVQDARRDGIILLRKGKKELYLGDGVKYAQVKINIDENHYIKGMAIYANKIPHGVDAVLFGVCEEMPVKEGNYPTDVGIFNTVSHHKDYKDWKKWQSDLKMKVSHV